MHFRECVGRACVSVYVSVSVCWCLCVQLWGVEVSLIPVMNTHDNTHVRTHVHKVVHPSDTTQANGALRSASAYACCRRRHYVCACHSSGIFRSERSHARTSALMFPHAHTHTQSHEQPVLMPGRRHTEIHARHEFACNSVGRHTTLPCVPCFPAKSM